MEILPEEPILPTEPAEAGEAETRDLPMIVWLRGDEEICSEFVLDAEEVMALLGIKRSRLTQIAGKELRVGRMRRGRYVSPVFRPVDVEAYLAWTRAPASTVKSSTILTEAATELKRQGASLAEGVSETLRHHTEEILSATTPRLERLEAVVREQLAEQRDYLAKIDDKVALQATASQLVLQRLGEMMALWRTLADDVVEVKGLAGAQEAALKSQLAASSAVVLELLQETLKETREATAAARDFAALAKENFVMVRSDVDLLREEFAEVRDALAELSRESKRVPSSSADGMLHTSQTSCNDTSRSDRKLRRARHAVPPGPARRRPSMLRR